MKHALTLAAAVALAAPAAATANGSTDKDKCPTVAAIRWASHPPAPAKPAECPKPPVPVPPPPTIAPPEIVYVTLPAVVVQGPTVFIYKYVPRPAPRCERRWSKTIPNKLVFVCKRKHRQIIIHRPHFTG